LLVAGCWLLVLVLVLVFFHQCEPLTAARRKYNTPCLA
jgi:hypothetical protein